MNNNELKVGSKILAMDEGVWMVVESVWGSEIPNHTDFEASYKRTESNVSPRKATHNALSYKRQFSFKDEGVKWKRVFVDETEAELQVKIRLLFDDILDEQPNPFIIEKVAAYCRENDEFARGIVMESDVRENILCVLREGLRALECK